MRNRKRSAAITLVLAGSATLMGCGKPVEQRDAYTSLDSCTRDWNNTAMCEPVRDNRYPASFFYGPPYYGNGTTYSMFGRTRSPAIQPSPNAAETYRVQTGSVQSSARAQQAMTMGFGPRARAASSSGSSSVSRGGFGSTGASSSSSSSSS